MANTARSRSSWYNPMGCRSCGHSGNRATMRRLSKRVLTGCWDRSRDRKGVVLLGAALLSAVLWAQDQPIFRSDTRLVVCHVTVVDKNGHFVTNLPQDAFTVFENGTPQPVKIFRREDVPVSMGLIIDNSG